MRRPKKPTYAELEAQRTTLTVYADCARIIIQGHIEGETPDITVNFHQHPHSLAEYTFELWGADRPDGGALLIIYSAPNQRPSITLHWFEEYLTTVVNYQRTHTDYETNAELTVLRNMQKERDEIATAREARRA